MVELTTDELTVGELTIGRVDHGRVDCWTSWPYTTPVITSSALITTKLTAR